MSSALISLAHLKRNKRAVAEFMTNFAPLWSNSSKIKDFAKLAAIREIVDILFIPTRHIYHKPAWFLMAIFM